MKEKNKGIYVKVSKELKRKIDIYCAERSIMLKDFLEKAIISELRK